MEKFCNMHDSPRLNEEDILLLKGLNKFEFCFKKAIICYQNLTIEFAKELGFERIDLNITGKIYSNKKNKIVLVKPFGVGAPNLAMIIEELNALKISHLLEFGTIGTLQKRLKYGDCILCQKAKIGEGTSKYYIGNRKFSFPNKRMFFSLKNFLDLECGTVFSTDAPYRETESEIRKYSKLGILGMNMETSAFFSACNSLGLNGASLCIVSDLLLTKNTIYFPEESEDSLRLYFNKVLTWFLNYFE